MKTPLTLKVGAAVLAAIACLFAMAVPASATVHSYSVTMVSGRIQVGSQTFDTPGSGVAGCPSGTTIAGTINDVSGAMTGSLNISSPFTLPALLGGGTYKLETTGAGTGTYNPGAGTFSLSNPSVTFTIKSLNSSTCATGAQVCTGTASLSSTGALYNGSTLPFSAGEGVSVTSGGSITSRGACSFPFTFFISSGTSISVSDNPNDDYAPVGTPDGGAIFLA